MVLGVMGELSNTFSAISEFAIGLAGFTGVVFVLTPDNASNRTISILRFANLLTSSFAAGFFALLPMILNSFSPDYPQAISIAMICFAIFMSAWIVLAYIYVPKQGIVVWVAVVMFGGAVLVLALQIIGLFLLPTIRSGLYSAGLFILLLQAAIVFAYAALNVIRGPRDAN